ncbi:MAG: FkbM family methyltransferase, partial [Oscillospiraceae bacterium]|nr:FkbM family methyltransferase [Oscillospiraceae bacterium]
YGTGDGADKVFSEFDRLGIVPDYVVASDTFARERTFHGYKVLPISLLEEKLANFTVAVCFASGREEVIENIKKLTDRHTVIMPSVPVYGDEIFNKDYLKSHLSEVDFAYGKLADEKSKEVFKSIIEFQITGDLNLLFACETVKAEALSLLELTEHESYLDLGAYRGDTVDELVNFAGGYAQITAVEPDTRSFKKLCEHCGNMKNISFINAVVSDKCVTYFFGGNKGRGGSIKPLGTEIPSITVDSLKTDFTYIKADTEGAELKMLCGAVNTLQGKPKLNIAAYHRSEDIFSLVNKINEINPEYKIYIRHHRHISFWDTNLYCK